MASPCEWRPANEAAPRAATHQWPSSMSLLYASLTADRKHQDHRDQVIDLRLDRKKSQPAAMLQYPSLLSSLLAPPTDRARLHEKLAPEERRAEPAPLDCARGAEVARVAAGSGRDASSAKQAQQRRKRTMFCEWQLSELEWRFDRNKYLITSDRVRVAKLLNLNQLQVKTWFQNRRMKWKKQLLAAGCSCPLTRPKGRPRRDSIAPIEED